MKPASILVLLLAATGQVSAEEIKQPLAVADEAVVSSQGGFDWTGFYAGMQLSTGSVDDSFSVYDSSSFGAQLGYLHDFGTFVAGGEISYSKGELDASGSEMTATRAKLIGGYDAGAFLPYAFFGIANIEFTGPGNDTLSSFGLGARYAFGPEGRYVAGLEYSVDDTDNFNGFGFPVDTKDLTFRVDFRF